jgi:hypothetical protein
MVCTSKFFHVCLATSAEKVEDEKQLEIKTGKSKNAVPKRSHAVTDACPHTQ